MRDQRHPWTQLASGRVIDLIDPDLSEVTLEELVFGIAGINRYAAQTDLSVAQHSVMVCDVLPPQFKRWGLCHDLHEALMGDVVSPVKQALRYLGGGQALSELDGRLQDAVAGRLGLSPTTEPPEVHVADLRMLQTERRDLLPATMMQDWEIPFEPYPDVHVQRTWGRNEAIHEFMCRFQRLSGTT